jgi:voltage-gated sodium channel type II alpha
MSTSAGWDGVLDGIINEEECDPPNPEIGFPGNCGSATVGITFMLTYLVISFLIVINMYIAVILENYSQATEDVQEGLTDDDYDMYYEIWQQFDPDGTQYIRYDQLSDFLDVLEPPLQIHKPNKYKIISMDIPICKGDLMFCVDILDALTKDFFARKGNPIEEAAEFDGVNQRPNELGYEPVSSTLWRQREEYCARLIQHAWRKHKQHKGDGHDGTGDENETGDERDGPGTAGLGSSHSQNNELGGGVSLGSGTLSNNTNNPTNLKSNSNDKISQNDKTSSTTTTTNTVNNNSNTNNYNNHTSDGKTSPRNVGSNEQLGRQTAVLVESDGFVTKNGHRVVIHSRSPSITSRSADV